MENGGMLVEEWVGVIYWRKSVGVCGYWRRRVGGLVGGRDGG